MNFQWSPMGSAIETSHTQWYFAIECVVSIAPRAEVHSKFTVDFTLFLYNFFIFSQWPLIFYIIKFNKSLYRFLLNFFKLFVTVQ